MKRENVFIGMTLNGQCERCRAQQRLKVTEICWDHVEVEIISGPHDGDKRFRLSMEDISEGES